jgi:hypothetical protein
MEYRYRLSSISTKRQYRSSELRYRYIPISKISRYRQMLLPYLYTISKFFCFNIEFRVLRYRCFLVGSSLGCLLGTGHRLRCAYCIANQPLPVAHAPPGPPSAAAAEAALGGAAAPAAPGAAPAAAAGAGLGRRSSGRRCRSGRQLNAGARDSWR